MKKLNIVYVIATCTALAACGGGGGTGGGGGVNPIPAPPPAPPPSPPPPPPPPPTTANADLINLSQSETFTNDSRTGTATYPKTTGNFSATGSATSVSIVYDAPSQTYSLTNGTRAQSFAAANIDAASSNAQITVYKKTSGTTTDTLTLTKPATSGATTFRYVGGAFWQRTIDGTSAISGEFDAITYGVETPDNAIVRTGGANYDTSLIGIVARADSLYSLAGQATLGVNFLTGVISGRALQNGLRETNAQTGAPGLSGDWQFNGNLSGSANAITGTVTLYPSATNAMSGSANGRLYGPASDELGIAFQADGTDGSRAIGTILGRKSTAPFVGSNPSLTNLQFDETFSSLFSGSTGWSANSIAGLPSVFSSNYQAQPSGYNLKYTAANQSFSLFDRVSINPPTLISTVGTSDASLTDSKFLGYSTSSTTSNTKLRMYRVGSSNAEIALTYSSYYNLVYVTELNLPGSGFWNLVSFWQPFGVTTPNAAMPTTGTANYSGSLNGSAINGNIGDPILNVTGTVAIAVNFGTAGVTGTINPIITNQSGSTYDLGTYSLLIPAFGGGYINPGVNRNGISGPPGIEMIFGVTPAVPGLLYNGVLNGTFFGPAGEELTGRFQGEYVPQGSSGISGRIWGAFGTKKTSQ